MAACRCRVDHDGIGWNVGRHIDVSLGIQGESEGALRRSDPRVAARDYSGRDRVSTCPGGVDNDLGNVCEIVGVGDVEVARGVERDLGRAGERRVVAGDRVRRRGVPVCTRGVDRDIGAAGVGNVKVARRIQPHPLRAVQACVAASDRADGGRATVRSRRVDRDGASAGPGTGNVKVVRSV